MKFYVMKKGGKLDANVSRVMNALYTLEDGFYEVTIRKHKGVRTSEQNRYLWGVVYPCMLEGLQEAGWELTDVEEVHEYMKSAFLGRKVLNRNTGEVLSLGESTSGLSRAEFVAYVEKLREYSSEYLHVYIPSSDEEGFKEL